MCGSDLHHLGLYVRHKISGQTADQPNPAWLAEGKHLAVFATSCHQTNDEQALWT